MKISLIIFFGIYNTLNLCLTFALAAKFWTAPELLRQHHPPPEGTLKGDVYSFAIICQEVVYRNGAFWVEQEDLSSQGKLLDTCCCCCF